MDIRQKPIFFSSHYLTKLQDSVNHEEEKYLPEENKRSMNFELNKETSLLQGFQTLQIVK